ncbi:MAG: alpha/beta hydrolase [Anaerolineae bacterium]|nr:alpha/beta hydrolase [Anaerolineae bacterium]
MPFAKVGGLNVHYLEQGSGEPVVLVHGNTSSSAWWQYTLDRMGGAYHFIAPDLRGRGQTQGPSADWTVEMLAQDLSGLLAQIGVGAAHFVGHSLGSNVALQYALDHKDRVKSLTLLNPGWVAGDMPAEVGDPVRVQGMVADKNILKMALRGIAMMHPEGEAWDRLVAASLQQTDEASLRGPVALQEWVVVDRLSELAGIPTLVVRGAGDQFIATEAVCRQITDHLPGAKYVEIAGATHSPNVETPDAWVELLIGHLASASQKGTA